MNSMVMAPRKGMLAALTAFVAGLILACTMVLAPAQADAAVSTASNPRVGATIVVSGNTYKVTDRWEGARDPGEVMLVKYASTNKKPVINTIKYKGKVFEVEKIAKNAFNNAKGRKITHLTLGRNVDYIGAKAFYGCSKLAVINIAKADVIEVDYSKRRGYYLDDVEIGAQAFGKAGVKYVKVKCGNAKAGYQKVIKKALVAKGLRSTAKVIK